MKKYGVSYLKRTRGVHMLLWYTTCMHENEELEAKRNGVTKPQNKRGIIISRTQVVEGTTEHTCFRTSTTNQLSIDAQPQPRSRRRRHMPNGSFDCYQRMVQQEWLGRIPSGSRRPTTRRTREGRTNNRPRRDH